MLKESEKKIFVPNSTQADAEATSPADAASASSLRAPSSCCCAAPPSAADAEEKSAESEERMAVSPVVFSAGEREKEEEN